MDVVTVIDMVVVVDTDFEVGYMAVDKFVTVVASIMEVMVDMAIVVGGIVEVEVVVEEVGITNVRMLVTFKEI